jgi:hypothetical protein
MSDPAAFQNAFGAALAGGGAGSDRALARALIIHRNTSAKAAQDALADNHPVVRALVGDGAFFVCAAAYADTSPPRDPRLCLYGEGFGAFIGEFPPLAELTYLPDVAHLERMVVEALFAADAEALDGAALARGLDPALPLRLHPAVRFRRFASPAVDIWRAHQDDDAIEALDEVTWRPTIALVTRPADAVEVRDISPGALAFLTATAAGAPLAEAALAAGDADVAEIFSSLILAGAFA